MDLSKPQKTHKEDNKDKMRQLLNKIVPKRGIRGTARILSKETEIPISKSSISRWVHELGVKHTSDRHEARRLFGEKKTKKIIEKLDSMEKESNE